MCQLCDAISAGDIIKVFAGCFVAAIFLALVTAMAQEYWPWKKRK